MFKLDLPRGLRTTQDKTREPDLREQKEILSSTFSQL
jgi:hypothetical protein